MSKPLDPEPWQSAEFYGIQRRFNMGGGPRVTGAVFNPRPEYEQDRSKYAE